jgi:peptide/nickel transport system permease protein
MNRENEAPSMRFKSIAALFSRRSFLAGLAILGIYVGLALAAPLLYASSLAHMTVDTAYVAKCGLTPGPTISFFPFHLGAHPFGETQFLGYDVAQGLIVGNRWDLALVTAITVPSVLIGIGVGLAAAVYGGKVDWAFMTAADTILSIPYFVFVILIVVILTPRLPQPEGPDVFVLAMVLVMWAPFARGIRGDALQVMAQPYVEAARASGASRSRIAVRHLLPNSLNTVFAQIPVVITLTIALVVGVQFVTTTANLYGGHGGGCSFGSSNPASPVVPAYDYPEWGAVLAAGIVAWIPISGAFLSGAWWGFVVPALWICGFGLGVLFLCDGLRDWASPKARNK